MLIVEPTTTIVSQTPVTTQILTWVNGLTLPALIIAAIQGTRWATKKEDAIKAAMESAKTEVANIRDNHLHHIQETLNEIKTGQKDTVTAVNSSKDAIVNAILTLKN